MDARTNRLLVAAAGSVAALTALLLAAYFVGPVARSDAIALHGLMTLSEHRWIWVVNDGLAHSVDLPFLVAALLVICGAGLRWGRPRQAVAAALLVGGANIATQVVKIAAAHPRYQPILGSDQLAGTAFPSGHATAAMSLALAAVLVAPSRWRPATAIVGGAFALVISIALVIQGWHFPSDVLGGFLVAGTVSMLALAGLRAIEGRRAGGAAIDRQPRLSVRSISLQVLEALAAAVAIGIALLMVTHPNPLTSYAATHTTSVLAAIGIAAASVALIYGVALEADSR
ncbi:MAG TPA: phosphatase PAP2 family protein [Solirubrobacterales bacterium]|jgi:membrane-associated phospholipid phosphatase